MSLRGTLLPVAGHFVVELRKGPAWDHSRARREQAGWDEHAAFMDELAGEGFVVLAGPIGEGDGENALLVVDASDEAGVRARLAEDPWLEGVLTVESIRPWSVWLRAAAGEGVPAAARWFLVERTKGPAWDRSRGWRTHPGWDEHAAFMDRLAAEGVILLGGPVGEVDGDDVLLVVQGEDEASVRARLAEDPWPEELLAIERIRLWSVWLRAAGW